MRQRLGATVIALVTLAIVCGLGAAHAGEIAGAFADVPPWAAAAVVGLHLVTLALRSEAWRMTLPVAGGERLPHRTVHLANSGAFLAGALQSHATLPARVALLKRFAGSRAPGPGQICVADVPILALELCATTLVLAAAVVAGRGAWWMAPAALGLGLGVLIAARLAPALFAKRPILNGLAVLADRRRRGALVALVAAIVGDARAGRDRAGGLRAAARRRGRRVGIRRDGGLRPAADRPGSVAGRDARGVRHGGRRRVGRRRADARRVVDRRGPRLRAAGRARRAGHVAGSSRSSSSVDQPKPRAPSPCPVSGW